MVSCGYIATALRGRLIIPLARPRRKRNRQKEAKLKNSTSACTCYAGRFAEGIPLAKRAVATNRKKLPRCNINLCLPLCTRILFDRVPVYLVMRTPARAPVFTAHYPAACSCAREKFLPRCCYNPGRHSYGCLLLLLLLKFLPLSIPRNRATGNGIPSADDISFTSETTTTTTTTAAAAAAVAAAVAAVT